MNRASFIIVLTLIAAVLLAACSSSRDESASALKEESAAATVSADADFFVAPGTPAAPQAAPEPAFAPAPPLAPAPSAISSGRAIRIVQESEDSAVAAQLVSQRRIIVRTVDMSLVVLDVAASLDAISDLAKGFDGWVVSSDRSRTHSGFISIRVPSDDLDAAILELRAMAKEVEREVTTSRDVTDEYVDLNSRLTNQQATEGALLKLLERPRPSRPPSTSNGS